MIDTPGCPNCNEPLIWSRDLRWTKDQAAWGSMPCCFACNWPKEEDAALLQRVESIVPIESCWDATAPQRINIERLYQRMLRLLPPDREGDGPIKCTEIFDEDGGEHYVRIFISTMHGDGLTESAAIELRHVLLSPTIAKAMTLLDTLGWGDAEGCARALWTLAGRDPESGQLVPVPTWEPVPVVWTFEYEYPSKPGLIADNMKLTREERDFLMRLWRVPPFEPGEDEWEENGGLDGKRADRKVYGTHATG